MSLPSSSLIAQGRTAEIFAWDDQHVLKLFRDWCPPDWAEYEARIARAIHAAGIPSPETGEVIEVNGRRGLIYERLTGVSMLQELNARPWTLFKQAGLLADLQIKIHQRSIVGLPSYKERLSYDIRNTPYLDDDLRNKVLALLNTLPDGKYVCHGDFHPGNVILTPKGPTVIDWMAACSGSRWADVARTSLLLNIGVRAAGKQVQPVLKMLIRLYYQSYLRRYLTLIPDTEKELNRWTPVIAAGRLNEDISLEREALVEIAKEGVKKQIQ
ncbi:MAG TPA: aminoglycoside phosphotransferase family protein [Anaerolineales bacterium]|nr:aminoglycoside phosphotransferase family protein [Anaerolineales bacterium]